MELWRRAAGVTIRRYGALETRCARMDVEYGGMELWRRAAGVVTGGLEACCKRDDYRGLEAYCRRVDVEVWRRDGGGLQACRRGRMEGWSSGVLEEAEGCEGIERSMRGGGMKL